MHLIPFLNNHNSDEKRRIMKDYKSFELPRQSFIGDVIKCIPDIYLMLFLQKKQKVNHNICLLFLKAEKTVFYISLTEIKLQL